MKKPMYLFRSERAEILRLCDAHTGELVALVRMSSVVDPAWMVNLHVGQNARIIGLHAGVRDEALVQENACVFGRAQVLGVTHILGNASIFGNAVISEYATVEGNASVSDDASVRGHAVVRGDARVRGKARIGGTAEILGGMWDGSEGAVNDGRWFAPGIRH